MTRVCIVHSRVGGGHLSAARALQAALAAAASAGPVQTRVVDAYLGCARWPVSLFPSLYRLAVRHNPRLWSAFYRITNQRRRLVDADRALGWSLRPGFDRLMRHEQPDIVVSVLPGVNGLLVQAAAAARRRPRVEVVLTDWYAVHRTWVGRGVRHYTVATEAARRDCLTYGVDPANVDVVGLPVQQPFAEPPDHAAARASLADSLGLDPARFTVVVMVGAEGSPRSLANVRALLQTEIDGQLVVVCGHNEALRQQVAGLSRRVSARVVGFRSDVATLMRGADLLVTKAGGITLAEAFCCGVPTVVADALPGQEAGNLAYALQQRAVAYAGGPAALAHLVVSLKGDPAALRTLGLRGAALARPRAAHQIAAALLARGRDGQLSARHAARPQLGRYR